MRYALSALRFMLRIKLAGNDRRAQIGAVSSYMPKVAAMMKDAPTAIVLMVELADEAMRLRAGEPPRAFCGVCNKFHGAHEARA